jgi:hypothetical protein
MYHESIPQNLVEWLYSTKQTKKLESKMMVDHFVPQTKHPQIVLALNLSVAQEKRHNTQLGV